MLELCEGLNPRVLYPGIKVYSELLDGMEYIVIFEEYCYVPGYT